MAENGDSYWTRRRGIKRSMAAAINELISCEMVETENNNVGLNCSPLPLSTPGNYPNTACNEADDFNTYSGDLDLLLPLSCDEFKDVDNDDCNSVLSSEPDDCTVHANIDCLQDMLASWAVDHNVTISAVGGLLKILTSYFPDLPVDGRT